MALLDTRSKYIRNLPGFGLTATLAVAFLYAPILFLLLYSFNSGRSISRLDVLSWQWYQDVFANEDFFTHFSSKNQHTVPSFRMITASRCPLRFRRLRENRRFEYVLAGR